MKNYNTPEPNPDSTFPLNAIVRTFFHEKKIHEQSNIEIRYNVQSDCKTSLYFIVKMRPVILFWLFAPKM